jgi:voltage-gated potassium channel
MLAEIPLFEALSRRHLEKVAAVAATKRFRANTPLVRKGQAATAFYVILDGRVRVDVPGRVELGAGEFFGEMALIDGEPRSATIVALTDVYALVIPRPKFLKVLESEPKIALAIMATQTRRMRRLMAAAAL